MPPGTPDADSPLLHRITPSGHLVTEVSSGIRFHVTVRSVSDLPGAALDTASCHASHVLVVASSAGVSAGNAQLQGALDNTNFADANVTGTITGGTVTAWAASV
jgi:hypothetical protein